MTIYQRLEVNGWQWVTGNSRRDYFRKGSWLCEVPVSEIGRIKFWRLESRPTK